MEKLRKVLWPGVYNDDIKADCANSVLYSRPGPSVVTVRWAGHGHLFCVVCCCYCLFCFCFCFGQCV